jgi:Flp pilus assembly protein TadD
MFRRFDSLLCLGLVIGVAAYAKTENWIQIRSPHFVVITPGSDKDGRRVADQLERMRDVFHSAFPNAEVDPPAPIVVIAVDEDKDFKALEPAVYLAKGSLQLGGVFLRAPDKNYILLRLREQETTFGYSAEDPHPYSIVYHEYTHLLTSKAEDWMPLWLNEGLAQFFENTEIRNKEVKSGEPSRENILLLRQNKLLPLATLFAVDHSSPYYHEQNKGSMFYAESWALTHYFQIEDRKNGTHKLADYMQLVAGGTDPVTAGTKAFGDLNVLQKTLDAYVSQFSFMALKMNTTIEVDDSTFVVTPLTLSDADAIRADFLAYNGRSADAKALIDAVMKADPKNAQPYETMGYLDARGGNLDGAREWYGKAVKLESKSYLAYYNYSVMNLHGGPPPADLAHEIEAYLRTAIKLNPNFAPSYDTLAAVDTMKKENLDEAHSMTLMAVQLDPENFRFRIDAGNVLIQMNQPDNAVRVFKAAQKYANTPEEQSIGENSLKMAEQYQNAIENGSSVEVGEGATEGDATVDAAPVLKRKEHPLTGQRHEAKGILKNVRCSPPAVMDFEIVDKNKSLTLHSDDYYDIEFSALGFTPTGDLHPCSDIENLHGRVQFVDSPAKGEPGQIVSVELSK